MEKTYDALDNGVGHLVGVEELGLGLATVGALGVPPAGSITIESGTSTVDGDLVASDGDEGAVPLLVAEGGGTLEDDVGLGLEASQVKSGAGRDGNVVESDGGASLLVLDSRSSVGEGTAVTLGEGGGSSNDGCGSQCHSREGSEKMHSESWNE